MKRLALSIAAMLCCFLGFSQGAEDGGSTFLVIPRFELNPYVALGSDAYSGFDLSNTSLYTLFEGNIGNSPFSYSIEGHWLSTDPSALYSNTFHSDEVNWLDWANITYAPSNWYLTLGKDVLSIGSFEIDEYDFDQHINLGSSLWNNLQVYQWGLKTGWANDDETFDASFQLSSSPYSIRPFGDNLLSYSLALRGEYGIYSTFTSVNALAYDKGAYVGVIATGNKLALGDFELGLDATFRGYDFDLNEKSLVGTLNWSPSESFSLMLKGGFESVNGLEDVFGWNPILDGEDPYDYYVPASLAQMHLLGQNYFFGGAAASWYPTDDLRLHATVAANNWAKSLSLNIGATYFLDLKRFCK